MKSSRPSILVMITLSAALAAGCQRADTNDDPKSDVGYAPGMNSSSPTTGAGGQKMDHEIGTTTSLGDIEITTKVKSAFITTADLKSTQIDVRTSEGVVTLTGTIDSQQSMERAAQVARSIEGVKSVNNLLSVKSRG